MNANKVRIRAAQKIYKFLKLSSSQSPLTVNQAAGLLSWHTSNKRSGPKDAACLVLNKNASHLPAVEWDSSAISSVPSVEQDQGLLKVRVDESEFIDCVISDAIKQTHLRSRESLIHNYQGIIDKETGLNKHSKKSYPVVVGLDENAQKEKVLVEFSSPNIAKPFHVGHLRSTLIGNTISNVLLQTGKPLTRVNYLGDWGTQFGYLLWGLRKYGDEMLLKESATEHLVDIYVKANQAAEEDTSKQIHSEAKEILAHLEHGTDESLVALWDRIRDIAKTELDQWYQVLGVQFDAVEAESSYHLKAKDFVKRLEALNVLKYKEGLTQISLEDFHNKQIKSASLLKSDGTSLYLTRDLCALEDRMKKYEPDRLLYVVEKAQHRHFEQLVMIGQLIGAPWAQRVSQVSFGRVAGMSTRKGTAIHLHQLLEETQQQMLLSTQESSTTRSKDMEETALKLAISGIVVNDLKRSRQLDYKFNMEEALSPTGDSGPFIQYSHVRLCSLEKRFHGSFDPHDVPSHLLVEDEALLLLNHIARFDDILRKVSFSLQPSLLIRYTLDLCQLSNFAFGSLLVRDQSQDVAQARLALFLSSRNTLAICLRLIGVEPLEEM